MKKAQKCCKRCGSPVKETRATYCSPRCSALSTKRTKDPSSAVDLYLFGVGQKTAAKQTGVSRSSLRRELKRLGIETRKHLASVPWNRGLTGVQDLSRINPMTIKRVEKMIIKEYERETSILKQTDENNHWSQHPEFKIVRRRWLSRRHRILKTNYGISKVLRTRVRGVLKGLKKSAPTLDLIGCSVESLREVLEFQFQEGMTWQNHGTHWEIDHRRPCASFDLSKPEEQRACFHWSNLQPLTVTENRRKSDSWQKTN